MNIDHDWRPLYSFRSRTIELDAPHGGSRLRYHYVDEGAGEPLLLVHGNPTWSFYWRKIVTALADRYRLIAVDHIGCGLSDKPLDYPYTLAQHTANLGALIRQLDLRDVTLLAHDWGGAIGLGAAACEPERFARYVLFNTAAFPPPHFPWRIRVCRTPLLGRWAVQRLNVFARAALTMALEDPSRLSPAERAGLLAPYDSWAHRHAIYRFIADIPATPRHPTWQVLERLEAALPGLATSPFLFIWGMRDWCFTPACLERFLQHVPAAEVTKLEDAGHYVVEEASEAIVERLAEFLTAHPLAKQTPAAKTTAAGEARSHA
ncbi:MAG: alpha/beta fold hydrolase [Planctomycetota bacterium]|nr:MAG: alpha/beta fold hydrolase [Planctomycetota bacterium]REJ97426.1 MAG: alpha/beta fold hydrolase [Planctomycetota bacterium]